MTDVWKTELTEQEVVEKVVAKLDEAPVECDGFVRIVSTVLVKLGISHTVCIGSLEGPEGIIPMHFWIQWNGKIIDCRARMWLGQNAPHGIFESEEGWNYQGMETTLEPLPKEVFRILANTSIEDLL